MLEDCKGSFVSAQVIVGIMQRLKKDSASITSAASETLGPRTAVLLSACYVFYMNATLVRLKATLRAQCIE